MGCLFALFAGFFPRLAMIMIWILRPSMVDRTFSSWVWPLLGIIFLPFATLIYVVLNQTGRGMTGWEWFWVGVAALLDVVNWGSGAARRGRPARRPA
ncbi:MAG TPA: hypothetical protein VGJ63_04070 [Micromonosporaceae bacterium]|jgi:uncharacterized membrane protein YczE